MVWAEYGVKVHRKTSLRNISKLFSWSEHQPTTQTNNQAIYSSQPLNLCQSLAGCGGDNTSTVSLCLTTIPLGSFPRSNPGQNCK